MASKVVSFLNLSRIHCSSSAALLKRPHGPLVVHPSPRDLAIRDLSSEAGGVSEAEVNLIKKLKAVFPNATDIAVADVSGGCGSMYEVYIEAPDFKGLRRVKQHQMVTDAQRADIKDMHGLRISTSISPES